MHEQALLPQLGFPDVVFGDKETPWNLSILLYKGGADVRADVVEELLSSGVLGEPQFDRLELVSKLHEEINALLASGGSRATASNQIRDLRTLFGFADRTSRPLTVSAVVETYCAWADSLFHRTRIKTTKSAKPMRPEQRRMSMLSAYSIGANVGSLLDKVLERHTRVAEMTRLEPPRHRKTITGVQAEKQNLTHTFAFGHLLQDICDGLTIHTTLQAPLPVHIQLRSGNELVRGKKERSSLANLRMEAELLMFIGQTGMNLAQAVNLELRHFSYVSHLDGYHVRDRKNRRKGPVLFEIFKDYKPHFERYLEWRRKLFPNSNRLFPFVGIAESRQDARFQNDRLRRVCKEVNIPYVSPRSLRNSRVNWLLRTTAKPDQTAEMAQHAKRTLLDRYEQPNYHRTLVETIQFWSEADPHLAKTEAVAPGGCTGVPKELADIPKQAPKPNCERKSGCLWCENHRDVDSFDYIWALASFKHLKRIELSRAPIPQRDDDPPPAKLVIDRIIEKLRWFETSNQIRREWVEEAETRINEGDFHPDWEPEISVLEGTA